MQLIGLYGARRAGILVCHEAPSCHPYGYAEIDELALAMGAKVVVHGHHHDSIDYRSEWSGLGFEVYGVAFRSIMAIVGWVISWSLVSRRYQEALDHCYRSFGLEEAACITVRPTILS